MNNYKLNLYQLVDLFMSEYGWTYDYTIDFISYSHGDIINNLFNTIIKRQKNKAKLDTELMAIAIGCALSGKIDNLDKLFKDNTIEEESSNSEDLEARQRGEMLNMWMQMGKDMKSFEEAWKSGTIKF